MKVLTFSRFFPKGHPKQGQETLFVEQILSSIMPQPLNLDDIKSEAKPFVNSTTHSAPVTDFKPAKWPAFAYGQISHTEVSRLNLRR
jgi:hypothetical protein